MSKIEVNTVEPQCGTTLTLGGSGDTVTLGSGASQSGFGRTGTVDWQTGSIKTSTFTAANGEGYFCNTTSGGFTVNLPVGSAGAIVSLQDYNNTFDSNGLIVSPNGTEKINGGAGSLSLTDEGQGITLVYVDGTVGWRSIQENEFSNQGSNYVTATGGTESTSGDWKIHTFTGPGNFTVTASGSPLGSNTVDYLVIAGGGGAAGNPGAGSGGGAGGYRESNPAPGSDWTGSPLKAPGNARPVSVQAYPITVGSGGAVGNCNGSAGGTSTFSDITSAGGGGGAKADPPQGNNGGTSPGPGPGTGGGSGGGGGAGAAGGAGNATPPGGSDGGGGAGGAGVATSITASPVTRAGGGGGGGRDSYGSPGPAGAAGPGGGGAGGSQNSNNATAGTANTGGGGGGGGENQPGKNGGSGIVVLRYKFQN